MEILLPKPVDLGAGNAPTVTAENYADYPLLILSRGEKKEIARVTANRNGNYRVELHRVIMFSMCKDARPATCARNRGHSRLSRIRLSASIWILTPALAKLVDSKPFILPRIRYCTYPFDTT